MQLRACAHSTLMTLLAGLGLTACDQDAPNKSPRRTPTADAGARAPSSNTPSDPDASAPKMRFGCTDSKPIRGADGKPTGIERCSEGYRHRKDAVTCSSKLPRSRACTGGGDENLCDSDAECTLKPHGFCHGPTGRSSAIAPQHPTVLASASPPNLKRGCICDYGCVQDSDCEANEVCECGSPVGECVRAECRTDADCSGGALCAESATPYLGIRYACQSPKDACMKSSDCPDPAQDCVVAGDSRQCEQLPIPGRPFLVEDHLRTAAAVDRDDWLDRMRGPSLFELSTNDKERLATHWTRAGLMEHASIAAFARFVLQLLEQGAPAALVLGAQEALADETRHARQCFALASAYAGKPIGPGHIDMTDAMARTNDSELLKLVIREGCIGETVAALEAAEGALWANDELVARTLQRIAEDETRHASLAWRFVAWMLAKKPFLAAVLDEEIAAATATSSTLETSPGSRLGSLLEHGVLDHAEAAVVRQRALSEVVLPCAQALRAPIAHGATLRS